MIHLFRVSPLVPRSSFRRCGSGSAFRVIANVVLILLSSFDVDGARKPFVVYDATLYGNKPDLSTYGVKSLPMLYAGALWPGHDENRAELPRRDIVVDVIRAVPKNSDLLCVDVESWPLKGDQNAIEANMRRLVTLRQWIRGVRPDLRIGYYAVLPRVDPRVVASTTSVTELQQWREEDDHLKSAAAEIDVLFPSLYTLSDRLDDWKMRAEAQITQARRFGRPVYVFLWPQFHELSGQLAGQFLPPEFWRAELELAYREADGVVIWGGWGGKGPAPWNDDAAWWKETKLFIRRVHQ
jgi:hypothetical protein